jgi:hypothetical protein
MIMETLGDAPLQRPAYAMVAVDPATMLVISVAGWTLPSLNRAAAEGLITVRTTWPQIVDGLLFSKLDEDQFMALSV